MSRGLSIFALILLAVVSFGLYQLSYEVQRLEEELIELNRALSQERETIGVLQAEWSYLTRPEYLQDKAQRLLEMRPATARDIVSIEILPWRQDRGRTEPGKTPEARPDLPPLAVAPQAKPLPAVPAVPVSASRPASASSAAGVPVAGFDAEVSAVLGAMQRGSAQAAGAAGAGGVR